MERRLHPVIGCGVDRVGPSTDRGRVTGLKGSPLTEKLPLAEHRVQRHRLRWWKAEHVASAAAARIHHIPWNNPLALFGPAGWASIEGDLPGAREVSIVGGRSWALMILEVVVVMVILLLSLA